MSAPDLRASFFARMSPFSTYTFFGASPLAIDLALRAAWYGAAERSVASTASRMTFPFGITGLMYRPRSLLKMTFFDRPLRPLFPEGYACETQVIGLLLSAAVTASFGLALLDPDADVIESIGRADQALLLAKTAGRNRAVAWDASVTTGTRWRLIEVSEQSE